MIIPVIFTHPLLDMSMSLIEQLGYFMIMQNMEITEMNNNIYMNIIFYNTPMISARFHACGAGP